MSSPTRPGAATARFRAAHPLDGSAPVGPSRPLAGPLALDVDDFEPAYLGWEIARCAGPLEPDEERALAMLAAACVASMRMGSTRVPCEGEGFAAALRVVDGEDTVATAHRLLERARTAAPGGAVGDATGDATGDAITDAIGRPGDRKPLVVDGPWLYAERMYALEERFCACPQARGARDRRGSARGVARRGRGLLGAPTADGRAEAGREGSPRSFVLPHHGRPRIGEDGDRRRAASRPRLDGGAHRLGGDRRSDGQGGAAPLGCDRARPLGRRAGDAARPRGCGARRERPRPADAAPAPRLVALARAVRASRERPAPPARGRGRRGVDDRSGGDGSPAPRAGPRRAPGAPRRRRPAPLGRRGRGLPGPVRRSRRGAAHEEPPRRRRRGRWTDRDGRARGQRRRRGSGPRRRRRHARLRRRGHVRGGRAPDGRVVGGGRGVSRAMVARPRCFRRGVLHARGAHVPPPARPFDDDSSADLAALFERYALSRILCATRVRGFSAGADAIGDRLSARLRGARLRGAFAPAGRGKARRAPDFAPGTPVLVQRNDYERGLYNGDQGIVVLADSGQDSGPRSSSWPSRAAPVAAQAFEAFPSIRCGTSRPPSR